jgi:hypothetical protein
MERRKIEDLTKGEDKFLFVLTRKLFRQWCSKNKVFREKMGIDEC